MCIYVFVCVCVCVCVCVQTSVLNTTPRLLVAFQTLNPKPQASVLPDTSVPMYPIEQLMPYREWLHPKPENLNPEP